MALKIFLSLLIIQNVYFIFADELMSNFEEGRNEGKRPKSAHIINELIPNERNRRQAASCFPPLNCNPYAYRSFDGTCNNLYNPYWGASFIPFQRFLQPQYEDGISSPRGTYRYPPLPRPRDVSVAVIGTKVPTDTSDEGVTLMTMQWGQFTDHDCFLTKEDEDEHCCSDFTTLTPTSESCMPINVTGDAFYSPKGVKCLPFVRSEPSPCVPGPQREQISLLTSFIDASQVYGNDKVSAYELREPGTHRLRFTRGENGSCSATDSNYSCRTFLPIRNNFDTGKPEFFGGDIRVEEQPSLTAMHNLPVRMHNDLADILWAKRRSNCSTPECVFQYARRIVIAIHQKITYGDFLPILVGTNATIEYGLNLQPLNKYFTCYDSALNPTVRSVVATACFRFGHSLLKDVFTLKPFNHTVELKKSFFNHNVTINPNSYPSYFLRGVCVDPAEEMDHIIVDAVHNFLFAEHPFNFGQDLYARNIARARDHGIASYPAWINRCGGAVYKFDDLNKYMPSAVVNTLNNLYGGRINDIDLFPAAMAEHRHEDGLLGPTCSCLISEFFHNVKYGDRFWFENPGSINPYYFTKAQLKSIKDTTLASLVCTYTGADYLPPNVFRKVSATNPLTLCSELMKKGVPNDITLNIW